MGWDALKGLARGLTADVVGAPVDLATMLANLGLAGVGYAGNRLGMLNASQMPGLIEKPVGGSDWFAGKSSPLTDTGSAEYTAGRLTGNIAPMLMGLAGKIPLQRDSSPNATVWHGSPHIFDKFDSSKIGTGEGAQAFGHGLYVAENPKVALEYKRALAPGKGGADDDTIARVLDAVGNAKNAASELERRAQYANIPGGKEKLLALAKKLREGYDPRGALYKVDLPDEHIAKMLDWDKPLSQQSPSVQKGLANSESVRAYMDAAESQRQQLNSSHPLRLDKIPSASIPYDATRMGGKDAWTALAREYGNQKLVSERLNELGIPGTRYLDANSRGAQDGTSNFVIFPGNESFLTILERNGIPLELLNGLAAPK